VKYIPRFIPYVRPYWKLAATTVVVTILVALVGLAAPWPLQILVDNVLGDYPLSLGLAVPLGSLAANRFALLVLAVVIGLIVALVSNGLNVLNEYAQTKLTLGMGVDLRCMLFDHAQHLSLAYHDRRPPGQFIYAINIEAESVVELITLTLPLTQSILTIVGMFWVSFLIDRRLALISLVVVPLLYYSVGYYTSYIPKWLNKSNNLLLLLLQMIHEGISMLPVVVAFGREDYEYRRYRQQGQRSIDAQLDVTVRQTMFSLVVDMITAAGTALVLGFGAYQALQGQLTTGQLLVILSYIASVYKPLQTISTTIGSLQNRFIIVARLFALLDTEPEIKDTPGAVVIQSARGQLSYEAVHFSYHGREGTLKDISFEARAGQVVALVGPTGAGKTTLVSLIPRFYDVTHGRILLDGFDVRELTLKSLREQISIVLQEPLLFSGSIADNIRYGKLDATMDEIVEAAKAANAHDFIMRLPDQYATPVGERGVQLSGGERQRICVARAFLKDAPILILDEPTSSIDSKTEAGILAALERLMVGRTTLLVAHRLSTIRHADQIVVLDRGQLVEQGSHEALLRRRGLYQQLYELQLGSARSNGHALGLPHVQASE
jgi:ATP-binding cassette subfamily B protein